MKVRSVHGRARTSRQRGYTILEVVVATALLGIVVTGAAKVFQSTSSQVDGNRVRIRAAIEHRRSLEAIANALRGADVTSLGGFDETWTSTSPIFARVLGASADARTLGETLQLEWQPSPTSVDGIPSPGAVYLVRATGRELLANRVPKDGFRVRQDGSTLVITVSTYHATTARRTTIMTGETAVTLRN